MPTQLRLPVQPAEADAINATVAVLRRDGQVAYFAAGVPLFTHRDADAVGQRIAAVQLMELGLARQDELSAALAGQSHDAVPAAPEAEGGRGPGRGRPAARPARARIASRPTSAGGWSSCWPRARRSGRRPTTSG